MSRIKHQRPGVTYTVLKIWEISLPVDLSDSRASLLIESKRTQRVTKGHKSTRVAILLSFQHQKNVDSILKRRWESLKFLFFLNSLVFFCHTNGDLLKVRHTNVRISFSSVRYYWTSDITKERLNILREVIAKGQAYAGPVSLDRDLRSQHYQTSDIKLRTIFWW